MTTNRYKRIYDALKLSLTYSSLDTRLLDTDESSNIYNLVSSLIKFYKQDIDLSDASYFIRDISDNERVLYVFLNKTHTDFKSIYNIVYLNTRYRVIVRNNQDSNITNSEFYSLLYEELEAIIGVNRVDYENPECSADPEYADIYLKCIKTMKIFIEDTSKIVKILAPVVILSYLISSLKLGIVEDISKIQAEFCNTIYMRSILDYELIKKLYVETVKSGLSIEQLLDENLILAADLEE